MARSRPVFTCFHLVFFFCALDLDRPGHFHRRLGESCFFMYRPNLGLLMWEPRGGSPRSVRPASLVERSFLGGEKRKYLTKDGVGDTTDAVDIVVIVAATTTSIRWRRQQRRFLAMGYRYRIPYLRGFRCPRRGSPAARSLDLLLLALGPSSSIFTADTRRVVGEAAPPHSEDPWRR